MGNSKPQASNKSGSTRPQGSGRRGARVTALRRPPEKGLPLLKHRMRLSWEAGLEVWLLWATLLLAVAVWCLLPRGLFRIPRVEAGTIAVRTFIADRDLSVVNEAATEELKRQTEASVPPVYDLDRSIEQTQLRELRALFEAGRGIADAGLEAEVAQTPASGETAVGEPEANEGEVEPAPDLLQMLTEASQLKVTAEQAEWFSDKGFPLALEDRLAGEVRRILRKGIVSDKALLLGHRGTGILVRELPSGAEKTQVDLFRYLDYPEEVRETLAQELRSWDDLARRDRALMADFVESNVSPNLNFNSSETLARREAKVDEAGTLSQNTRKGQVIVRKGELVDELAARTIAQMAGSRDQQRLWLVAAGSLLLLVGVMVLVWLCTRLEHRPDKSRVRLFNECLILLAVHVVGVRFSFFVADAISGAIQTSPWNSLSSYTFAIPFASLALLSVLLFGRNVAFVLTLGFAFLVGRIAHGESLWAMTFYSLASSLAAVFALDQIQFKARSVMIRVAWLVGLANAVAVLTLKALAGDTAGGVSELGFDLLCALTGAFLAAAVTGFAAPIFEALFGITTYIKLLELSNTNLPLLRRLALEAPGTFQHSIAVANLAKAGCEAIGLDSILVHTTALYHDIGKIYRPQYFVENQVPGQNPHDKIQPSMSALILINHVKEGLELASKHNLPQPIFDAIEQHHGTALIKFFYNRAQERCDRETDEVREDDFRYPGPKPQSKEMGILMLADGVEAASRTLVEPSRQKIRGLLKKLFDNALRDHQLDQTDLTLGDLGRVEEAFLNVLTNIYHRRIDYPGFDFNQGGKTKSGKLALAKAEGQAAAEEGTGKKRRPPSEELEAAREPAGQPSRPPRPLTERLAERKAS